MPHFIRYDIPLQPYVEERIKQEAIRAAKARKISTRKLRSITKMYPSVNDLYPINPRTKRKYLSPAGALWKEYIDDVLSTHTEPIPPWEYYDVTYIYLMTEDMLFTREGEISENDVSNFLKATEDALFDWLGESDKNVMSIRGYKRLTSSEAKLVIFVSEGHWEDKIYHKGEEFYISLLES